MRTENYIPQGTLEQKAGQWISELRAAVPARPHLVLEPERCALLVVDMNRYLASPRGGAFLPAASAIIPNIRRLIEVWREHRWPLAFTRHGHKEGDGGMLGRFFSDYIRETWPQAEIVDSLSPVPGEWVFPKSTYDAFLGTGLQEYLRYRKATQVLVTGVLTHMCCETTARSAFCRGFEVWVPVDATASSTEAFHVAALRGMASCVASPMITSEVLACARW